jgi:hypothetical protein
MTHTTSPSKPAAISFSGVPAAWQSSQLRARTVATTKPSTTPAENAARHPLPLLLGGASPWRLGESGSKPSGPVSPHIRSSLPRA